VEKFGNVSPQGKEDKNKGALCGGSFDFAQGRLLHSATDDETVRRFGRDDGSPRPMTMRENRQRQRQKQIPCGDDNQKSRQQQI
jgi:hypothetical protein